MNPILTSIFTISGIAGALALLLSIANRTIGNYGVKKLTINTEKTYDVEGGTSLLSTLISQDVFIPSACGGKGSCGYCKVKVLSGGGERLATENGFVTSSEAGEGIRLACQCKVKEDIEIEIPKALLGVKQQEFTVASNALLTPTIKHLVLKLPTASSMDFSAGQYVQILTPIYKGNEEEIYRAYSIASSPLHPEQIELFVGLVPEGRCSTYVHHYLKVGDKLTVIGPFGDFFYKHSDKPMILSAIGTGLAPIYSILQYMAANEIHREVHFYFGARHKEDLFMMDELEALQKQLPNCHVYPCLSKPKPEDEWKGFVGRVTDLMSSQLPKLSHYEAYLCGSPVMIDSVTTLLLEKEMPPEAIYYDKFE